MLKTLPFEAPLEGNVFIRVQHTDKTALPMIQSPC